jgi:putative transposase
MTDLNVSFSAEELEQILFGDAGVEVLMQKIFNEVLQAEMTEHLGADRYERNEDRSGYRHGSYERELTTRVGKLTLEVPRAQDGSFSTELFERYQRSEKALVLALMEMVVQGVSTRRVKKITTKLCGHQFTKSTVSRLTKGLEDQVEAWAERPLAEDYPFVLLDAMHIKVRRQGGVRSTAVLIAVGITEDGKREILGFHPALQESSGAWKKFIERLKERGLSGVEHVTSDAHEGLKGAIQEQLPGSIWTRCHAHFRRNVLDETPEACFEAMQALMDEVLKADSQPAAFEAFEEAMSGERTRIVETSEEETVDTYEKLQKEASSALEVLEEGLEEATAVLALPDKYRRRLRTTNMIERLIEELRRREKVIRIFPNIDSAWRLLGSLLSETHEEWSTVRRRYFDMAEYERWKRQTGQSDSMTKQPTTTAQPVESEAATTA